jgi:DNA-binding winged helix-turn-helix (wHTH) protein/TolB-like protein
MDNKSGGVRLRFGRFELDPANAELYRDGQAVRLQEHPRQVLVALLERAGEIVTREELRDRLWKSDTFVDFEHGLNTAVKKARQALNDSAEAPTYIETVARRGYRFIAAVEAVEPAGAAATDSRVGVATLVPRPDIHWVHTPVVWGVVIVLLVGGGVAWFARRHFGSQSAIPVHQPAVAAELAVLPFRVLTNEGDDSTYLGVGLADAITTRLANTRQIALRPTSAVLPFDDAQSDPIRVAASLGVQHLLLGSIQPTQHTYRVSVQLTRADGIVVWGRTFDEPRGALLELQDHLAEQVAAALRVELSAAARDRLRVRYTANAAAYEMYLRGRGLMVNYTEANMRDAIKYFERALEMDPNYALARAGVATASAWFSVRYAYEQDALAWGKRAEEEARRALKQDALLADAHFAIASAAGTLYGGFNWNVVLERSATALALDPSLDLAHLARMRAFYHLGLFEESADEARLARVLNPGANVELLRLEVATQLFAGEFGVAEEHAAKLLPRTDAPAVRHYLGLARYYMGDVAGGRELLASVTRGGHADARAQASLASIEAANRLPQEARTRIAAITGGTYMDHHVAYSLGAAFAQLGNAPESMKWLARAADTGFPCRPWFERDVLLEPVRGDPAFVRLMGRLRDTQEQARRLTH